MIRTLILKLKYLTHSPLSLAKNPNTPSELLSFLADEEDWRVRWFIARNLNTSPETLDRLAKDEHHVICLMVGMNPNTLPETLDRLANDKEAYIRKEVAKNPNTPPETLARLADDEDVLVRHLALLNTEKTISTGWSRDFIEWAESVEVEELENYIEKHTPKPIISR